MKRATMLCSRGLVLGLVTTLPVADAKAVEQRDLGQFGSWNAYSYQEGGSTVCFTLSRPVKADAAGRSRGEVLAYITHRPAENSLSIPHFVAGYTYKKGSGAKVTVDGKRNFDLFTEGDTAWARDDRSDKELLKAIRGGKTLVLKGTSGRGTSTSDTFSLGGIGKALAAIDKACNVKR